jgi:hypothetical protein
MDKSTQKAKRRFRFTPVKKRLRLKIRNKFNLHEDDNEYDKFIFFKDYSHNAINLLIQLRTDCITRSEFFRAVMYGYLERNPDMINFVENYIKKELKERTPQYYEKTLEKEEKEHEEIVKSFSFSEEELDNIFDLIEQELED